MQSIAMLLQEIDEAEKAIEKPEGREDAYKCLDELVGRYLDAKSRKNKSS